MAALLSAPKSHHGRIYGVSLASIVESCIFIMLYAWVISELLKELSLSDGLGGARYHLLAPSHNLAVAMIVAYGLRILFALAILTKTYNTCITFYIVTQMGVAFNLITGFLGTYFLITNGIGFVTLLVVGLHVVYIVMIHGVIKTMRPTDFTNQDTSQLPRSAAHGRSAIQPGLNSPHIINHQQGPCPPYSTDLSTAAPPDYAMAPPSYDVEFGNGQKTQSNEISNKF